MTEGATSRRFRVASCLGVGLIVLGLGLCSFGIFYLSSDVRREIDELATTNADNTQWSLAQNEIEVLALFMAADSAAHGHTSLAEARKRFDVFYSRAQTLKESSQFVDFRKSDVVQANIAKIDAFLERYVPLIDGDDAQLSEALPELAADAAELRLGLRDISLVGIKTFSAASDARRTSASKTLMSIAILTVSLVLMLLLMIAILFSLVRQSRSRATQQALTRGRLETIVTTSLDAIIVINKHGKIIDYNGAAEQVFGYPRDEAMGENMADLIVPDHLRAAHDAGMKRYLDTGERRVVGKGRVQLDGKRKDGTVFPVEFSVSSAMSEDGEIFISYLRDISAQVAAEKELVEARDKALAGEKAKADLLAVMSHEMRTPLNGMLGTLELLQDTKLTDRQRDYLDIINMSGNLLLHHVNDVLDISRLDSGKLSLSQEVFDANALTQDAVTSQRHVAETKGNKIRFSGKDSSLSHVQGDPRRLRQILLNLIGNAVKFTRNGEITVEAERLSDGFVEFRIIDTGIGIANENITRIFEDFVTIDATYMRTAGGTGLGLGIARRLAQAMGGDLGVESELGEGSLFWVRVPLRPLAPAEGQAQSTSQDGSENGCEDEHTKKLNILVVEDNHINRFVVREMLEKECCNVEEAHNGKEGVAMSSRTHYDLILMDISMPEMDGVEATKAIRATEGLNLATPIVALTAHALPNEVLRFKEAGMEETLTKPITRAKLRELVLRVTALHAEEQDGSTSVETEYQPIFDTEVTESLRSTLGEKKFAGLLNDFLAQSDGEMERISSDPPGYDSPETLVAAVHKLAGSASVFGAIRLRESLAELETALRSGNDSAVPSLIEQATQRWTETRKELLNTFQ